MHSLSRAFRAATTLLHRPVAPGASATHVLHSKQHSHVYIFYFLSVRVLIITVTVTANSLTP